MCRAPAGPSVHPVVEGEETPVQTYVILRRNGWPSVRAVEEAAARAVAEGEDMPDEVAWIRSYVLEERDGSIGTVCVYQASNPEAIRRHASAASLPVDEIVKVADTVVVRPDPAAVTA
jgi:sporulation protein YlmC with PRC-barrel domain